MQTATQHLPPPFAYFGAKQRLIPLLHQLIPTGQNVYCEPYAGSATVLFSCSRWASKEVINDLNQAVFYFFWVLRDYPERLIEKLHLTPYGREEVRDANEFFKEFSPDFHGVDPVEIARRFFVANQMSFSATKRGLRYKFVGSNVAAQFRNLTDQLALLAERLSEVIVESDPAIKVIERWDSPSTVFYCDPPYVFDPDTQQANHADMNRVYQNFGMTLDQHAELINTLKRCQGAVVLSGYSNPLYDRLLADWHSETIDLRNITHDPSTNRVQTEVIWYNQRAHDLNPPRLF